MRLRNIMVIVFCLTALAPMVLFWLWPNAHFLNNEKESVREYHQLLAKSISAELSSYKNRLAGTFQVIARQYASLESYEPDPLLMGESDILFVCLVDKTTGNLIRSSVGISFSSTCPNTYGKEVLEEFSKSIDNTFGSVVIGPVEAIEEDMDTFKLIYETTDKFVIGTVSTQFINDVGMRNRFGTNGHAIIVDRGDYLVSYPLSSVQPTLKMLGVQSLLDRIAEGGVRNTNYYSPLFKEEFIGGYSQIKGTGWSVLVSQPVAELEEKVAQMKLSALSALGVGLVLAVLLAFVATEMLTFPIIQIVQALERIGNGHLRAYEKIKKGKFQPTEFQKARDSIKAMAEKLRENIDTISQHAYLDGITGLPNRECFKVLAQEEIEKLALSGQKGALLFLDLDGFKQVNDVYGHRSGDDLLKDFAQKIHVYCASEMQRHASGVDNAVNILPARLGGDEFVVFLGNVRNVEMVNEFANGLFRRVFGSFILHNGIDLQVSGSVGGAMFPGHGSDFDELLRLADIAMYEAKNTGKGKFCLHQALDEFSVNEAGLAFEADPYYS